MHVHSVGGSAAVTPAQMCAPTVGSRRDTECGDFFEMVGQQMLALSLLEQAACDLACAKPQVAQDALNWVMAAPAGDGLKRPHVSFALALSCAKLDEFGDMDSDMVVRLFTKAMVEQPRMVAQLLRQCLTRITFEVHQASHIYDAARHRDADSADQADQELAATVAALGSAEAHTEPLLPEVIEETFDAIVGGHPPPTATGLVVDFPRGAEQAQLILAGDAELGHGAHRRMFSPSA